MAIVVTGRKEEGERRRGEGEGKEKRAGGGRERARGSQEERDEEGRWWLRWWWSVVVYRLSRSVPGRRPSRLNLDHSVVRSLVDRSNPPGIPSFDPGVPRPGPGSMRQHRRIDRPSKLALDRNSTDFNFSRLEDLARFLITVVRRTVILRRSRIPFATPFVQLDREKIERGGRERRTITIVWELKGRGFSSPRQLRNICDGMMSDDHFRDEGFLGANTIGTRSAPIWRRQRPLSNPRKLNTTVHRRGSRILSAWVILRLSPRRKRSSQSISGSSLIRSAPWTSCLSVRQWNSRKGKGKKEEKRIEWSGRMWPTSERDRDVWNERACARDELWEICLKRKERTKRIGGKFGIGGRRWDSEMASDTRSAGRRAAGIEATNRLDTRIRSERGWSNYEDWPVTDQSDPTGDPGTSSACLSFFRAFFRKSCSFLALLIAARYSLSLSLSLSLFLSFSLVSTCRSTVSRLVTTSSAAEDSEHLGANRTEFDESAAITLAFATVPFFSGVVNLSLSSASITDPLLHRSIFYILDRCNLIDILFCDWYT